MINDAMVPELDHPLLNEAMKELGCKNVSIVQISPRPHALINECHTNVARQVAWYGGEQIKGYYVAVSKNTNRWVAIKHSVWKREDKLIDVTPVNDKRTINVFIFGSNDLYTSIYSNNGELIYDKSNCME